MQEPDLKLDDYGISKNRYRELKYFCRQYREKKTELAHIRGLNGLAMDGMPHGSGVGDPTANRALRALQLGQEVGMIEDAAKTADALDWPQIISHVADGVPYEHLEIHSGRRQFYETRRKFFWLLNKARNAE